MASPHPVDIDSSFLSTFDNFASGIDRGVWCYSVVVEYLLPDSREFLEERLSHDPSSARSTLINCLNTWVISSRRKITLLDSSAKYRVMAAAKHSLLDQGQVIVVYDASGSSAVRFTLSAPTAKNGSETMASMSPQEMTQYVYDAGLVPTGDLALQVVEWCNKYVREESRLKDAVPYIQFEAVFNFETAQVRVVLIERSGPTFGERWRAEDGQLPTTAAISIHEFDEDRVRVLAAHLTKDLG